MITKLSGFICFIFWVALFFCVGCSQREDLEQVNFKDTIELDEIKTLKEPVLNVCVGSMITPEEGYDYYKRLLDYIAKKLELKVNFIEKRTYAEVNSLLKEGGIDLAFVCGGPYVEGQREFALELLVAPEMFGRTVYYSYIIVGKNSSIERLEDLRGKTFAFADPLSNTGKLVPEYMLQELNSTPEDFFKEYVYTYDHDKSIKAVAAGIVDGAAVDSLIWEYMDEKGDKDTQKTRIIKVSLPYGIPPVVVRPNLDPQLKLKLKNIFLNIHKEKDGAAILKGMFIDKFIEVDDAHYDGIRRIKASLEKRW